jgi:hypothetical protein
VHEVYGTLTILPGDPELSHVSPRFLGAIAPVCYCILNDVYLINSIKEHFSPELNVSMIEIIQ